MCEGGLKWEYLIPVSNRSISIRPLHMEISPRTCSDRQAVLFLCPRNLSTEMENGIFRDSPTVDDLESKFQILLTASKTELRRRSTFTILDKSPMFDSNSKKRFHTSTDSWEVKPPDDKTRSKSTRVLLSSVYDDKNINLN